MTGMERPTEKDIRDRLAQIDADERYHYEPAAYQVNAPLALVQISLKCEARALAWVLGVKPPKSGPRRKRKD